MKNYMGIPYVSSLVRWLAQRTCMIMDLALRTAIIMHYSMKHFTIKWRFIMGFVWFAQPGWISEQPYGNTVCFSPGALTGPPCVHDYGFGTSNCHNHALFQKHFTIKWRFIMGFVWFAQPGWISEQPYGNTVCFSPGALTGPPCVHDYGFGNSNCHTHAYFMNPSSIKSVKWSSTALRAEFICKGIWYWECAASLTIQARIEEYCYI